MKLQILSTCVALSVLCGPAAAAPLGIPGYFNPQTRIFVPYRPFNIIEPATTFGGTIKVAFTISVKSALPAGDRINCGASATVVSATGGVFLDTAGAGAAISGSTATCTVVIPYAWAGAASTDTVSLTFEILDTGGVRNSLGPVATFTVPANGKTTSYAIKQVF